LFHDLNSTRTIDTVRAISAPVVDALAEIPEVHGILCFGSYAMETFDRYSDIDLYVLCSPDILPAGVRRDVLKNIAGVQDLDINHEQVGWDKQWHPQDDRCRVGELPFEISYNTVDWTLRVVHAVKDRGITSTPEFGFRAYTMLGLLEHSVILHDPKATLQTLKASLYPYPAKLKQALLAESLPIVRGSLEDLKDYVRRSIGNSAFLFHYQRFLDSLGTILFAINERYDPATKRFEEVLRSLEILPDRFMERYTKILETPLTREGRNEIVRELETLLIEIEDLTKGGHP
jgi:predicted nucleotidyltransferase